MKRQRILAVFLAATMACTPALAFAQPQDTALADPIVRTADDQASDADVELQATYTTLNIPGTELYSEAFDVVDIVNQERAKLGRAPLTMDRDLMEAAMQRAAECVVSFSHTRPNGTTCFTISSKAMGENIAAGNVTAAATMEQWMNSDGHRENLLRSNWSSIGVGAFRAQNGSTYWVQLFGPGSAAAASEPADTDAVHAVDVYTGHIDPGLTVSIPGAGSSATSAILPRGFRSQIVLRGVNADASWAAGYTIASDSFAWTSSDTDVVSVDADGNLSALAPGQATITGVSGGLQIDIYITVDDESPFSDVDENQWYAQAVDFVASNGLLTGYSNSDRFGIGDVTTRAQLVTVLHRIAEPDQADATENNQTGMPDVENGAWYTAAANWAVDAGVISGIEQADGSVSFGPNLSITREQLAIIIARYVGADLAAVDTSKFEALPDHGSTSSWATNEMAWAVDTGLINGSQNSDGTRSLSPQGAVTREQAAMILMNAYSSEILP